MKLRVLALALAILAFFIFVGSPFQQAAKAVAIEASVIAVILIGLAAMGITFATTGGFDTLNEYVSSLLEEFALDQNTTVSGLLNGTQSGTDKLGRLLLNNRFVILISTFAAWLKAKFSIQEHQLTPIQTGGSFIGDIEVIPLPVTGYSYYSYQQNEFYVTAFTSRGASPTYLARGGDSHSPSFFYISTTGNTISEQQEHYRYGSLVSDETFTWQRNLELTNGIINGADFHPTIYYWYESTLQNLVYAQSYNVVMPPYYSRQQIANAINGESEVQNRSAIDVIGGTIVLPEDDPDYTDGDGAIIDIDLPWGSSYSDVIEGIESAFDDAEIPATTITYEGEQEVNDQVEDTQTESVSQNVSDYQVNGLVSVFPFCIPFDLYNFVASLAADPVAPSFTWRFYVPGICDESIEIDLSEFDAAAQILRTMELLLFCVGLAFVTRKIIRG